MVPLSKKFRRNIFIILMLVFILLVPVILAKSLGYKLEQLDDIFTLVKTGGIYLHSDITNAQIYLDDQYVEKNGLLLRNTLIQSLKPEKTYHVAVWKEGMNEWSKDLVVYPGVVTEARVLMLPVEVTKTPVFPFIDENGVGTTTPSTLILNQDTNTTNVEYSDLQELFDDSATSSEKISKQKNSVVTKKVSNDITTIGTSTATSTEIIKIPEYFIKLGISDPDSLKNLIVKGDQALWLSNGDISINWISENNSAPYFYCLDLTNCRTSIVLGLDKDIEKFDFLPGRDDVLVILNSDGIFAVEMDDRSQRNIQPIYLGQNLKFKIDSRDQIIVLDSNIYYKLEF
jgi:hypothetical protein